MPFRDQEHDALDPGEFPDSDPSAAVHMPCPYCCATIFDDSVRCPKCSNYLSQEVEPNRKPVWIVATALVLLALALYGILQGF